MKGIRQVQFARDAHLTPNDLRLIEQGRLQPSASQKERLRTILGEDTEALLLPVRLTID
jgi:transcriptional regulator with XRE-family HTH domain